MRCHAGDKWIDSTQDHNFTCTQLEQNHPSRSIEMFEARTCDITLSGSGSDMMRLKFCRQPDQFRSFEMSSRNKDCCSTNYFSLGSTRGESRRYDVISSRDKLDGGDVLGLCEGFDLRGSKIYVAMENWRSDYGCFDELSFFGIPSNTSSTTDLAFASCHFNPIFFSSGQVQQQLDSGSWSDWTDHMNLPVRCEFSVQTNSITRLNVKVCESRGSGGRDPLYVKLENDDGDQCETEGLPIADSQKGHFIPFSSSSLGSCKNFTVTQTTQAFLSNAGNDDLCITSLYLDMATQDGTTKSIRCRYDADTHLQYSMIVHGKREMPLICY